MRRTDHEWTLVLAAGSGTRLRDLTTNALGESIPKQFCSLNGGYSLLRRTLFRAFSVAPISRTTVVVADDHRPHWARATLDLPPQNVVVQPENKGTAVGILLPLLRIVRRDHDAMVVILPSDHYVDDETALIRAIGRARQNTDHGITLLGIAPEGADPELGYIVPERQFSSSCFAPVSHFVEKPTREAAETLINQGALWNSFIIVARGSTLIELIAAQHEGIVEQLNRAQTPQSTYQDLCRAYVELPSIDLSRDVLTPAADRLSVQRVPHCGWTDLGTPTRVAECLAQLNQFSPVGDARLSAEIFDLAQAYQRRNTRISARSAATHQTYLEEVQ